jgi:hypothetical protein
MKDKVILKLTKWEISNFHLPPVTTLTFYEGNASYEKLRDRLSLVIKQNPWITSRIVKKAGRKAVPHLEYFENQDTDKIIDQYLQFYDAREASIPLDLPYTDLYERTLPYQCAFPKPATNADEVMFKISIVPLSNMQGSAPLQHVMSKNGFALVVSMNHILGDGHTYYKLYDMLNEGVEIESMDPVRKEGFEEEKTKVIGKKETAMLASAGFVLRIIGKYLVSKMVKQSPQNVCLTEVDPSWADKEKQKAKNEGTVSFVSTNDAITSFFFRNLGAKVNLMLANFRSRKPAILGLTDKHVGNYEVNVPYFPQDVQTATLIRQSISTESGDFKARRATASQTTPPGFWTLIKNNVSIVTNWASFYSDLILRDKSDGKTQPKLHLPIMKSDGMISSMWNSAIIFRPRANKLGILMLTRKYDYNIIELMKKRDGTDVPFGNRLV